MTAFGRLECLSDKVSVVPNHLPSALGVGITNVLRDKVRVITTLHPLPHLATNDDNCPAVLTKGVVKGTVKDVLKVKNKLPQRFVISDGTIDRSFVGVDMRPGTRLHLCLEEIANTLTKNRTLTEEETYVAIRDKLRGYLGSGSTFPWDKHLPPKKSLAKVLEEAKPRNIGEPPSAIGRNHPVIPFESFLEYGLSFCFEKGLLAALVMQHLGYKFRVVMGGVKKEGVGHTWTWLEDGRALDPTWNVIGRPSAPDENGWFNYGIGPVYANQYFPFVELN